MPIGQAGDVLVFHGGQQCLALWTALEAVGGGQVVEQERQVEDLDRLGVLLELGQRRRQQLHVTEQQGFHLLAVAEQRGVRVDLDPDLARQALFSELLEQQRTLPLGRVVRDYMGELDDDRIGSLNQAGERQGHGADERLGGELEHAVTSFYCCWVSEISDRPWPGC
ncbi:hypothetical protein FQZ97_1035690 [compost metagenome]